MIQPQHLVQLEVEAEEALAPLGRAAVGVCVEGAVVINKRQGNKS